MCGRFSLMTIGQFLEERFHAESDLDMQPRYNIAPTQDSPVILNRQPTKIVYARFGLSAPWDAKKKLINTRLESLSQKRIFQKHRHQRCLVLADGFYEWKKYNGKQPYRITLKDEEPFAFAGIWDSSDGLSFSIITAPPNAVVRPIHDRMPFILRREDERKWLEGQDITIPERSLKAYRISKLINSPRNDSPDVINPAAQQTLQ